MTGIGIDNKKPPSGIMSEDLMERFGAAYYKRRRHANNANNAADSVGYLKEKGVFDAKEA